MKSAERKKTFVVVLIALLFAGRLAAQVDYRQGPASRGTRQQIDLNKLLPMDRPVPWRPFGVFPELIRARPGSSSAGAGVPGSAALADDYYSRHFGFFCKKELLFEKTTRIPLKFRLGSLDYCNSLEGKK